ncbi:MAG: RNA polymerase sigma factor [Bacteroidota bacterium]
MDQDDLLVEGCKAGNRQAQMEVYRKYSHRVYNTCLRMVCNPADAEDLMQNSFIDAFNRIKSYKGPSAFAGWLKKIAVNNAIDHLTRRRIQGENLEQLPDIAEYLNESEDYIEWRVDQVKRAMNHLIPDYRVILSLNLFEGYDQEEIGQILRLSQANVRTRISRAKHALVRIINERQPHDESAGIKAGRQ